MNEPPHGLTRKLALVTGASGSIGSAVAKRRARDLVHYPMTILPR